MATLLQTVIIVLIGIWFLPTYTDARALGGSTLSPYGPPIPSPNGGIWICTATMRKYKGGGLYDYTYVLGYSVSACWSQHNALLYSGWQDNPYTGVPVCQCYPGYYGMIVSPTGTGPLDEPYWTQAAIQQYDAGMEVIRTQYPIDGYIQAEQQLRDQIISSNNLTPETDQTVCDIPPAGAAQASVQNTASNNPGRK